MTTDDVLDALGDPTRRQLVAALAGGRRTVGELAAELPVSRSAVSQHLKVLREARIVACEADGTRRLYYLTPEGIDDARSFFDRLWRSALTDLKTAAEER